MENRMINLNTKYFTPTASGVVVLMLPWGFSNPKNLVVEYLDNGIKMKYSDPENGCDYLKVKDHRVALPKNIAAFYPDIWNSTPVPSNYKVGVGFTELFIETKKERSGSPLPYNWNHGETLKVPALSEMTKLNADSSEKDGFAANKIARKACKHFGTNILAVELCQTKDVHCVHVSKNTGGEIFPKYGTIEHARKISKNLPGTIRFLGTPSVGSLWERETNYRNVDCYEAKDGSLYFIPKHYHDGISNEAISYLANDGVEITTPKGVSKTDLKDYIAKCITLAKLREEAAKYENITSFALSGTV